MAQPPPDYMPLILAHLKTERALHEHALDCLSKGLGKTPNIYALASFELFAEAEQLCRSASAARRVSSGVTWRNGES